MVTVTLTEQEVVRVQMIEIDRDEVEALAFIRECLLPQIRRQAAMKMKNHLDDGKSSVQ